MIYYNRINKPETGNYVKIDFHLLNDQQEHGITEKKLKNDPETSLDKIFIPLQ
jgi:hypothetical protein